MIRKLSFWHRTDTKHTRLSDSRLSLIILLVPIFLLIPTLNLYPYPASGSLYSDLTISHYPNIQLVKNTLRDWGEIPLWSPLILSGSPFAANPLSGLWYPFGWLLFFLPLPFGFNLLIIMHLIWAGLGTYFLLKSEGVSHVAALFAGLAFSLLPKFYSHYGAGHLTLLFAIPWTPWLLLSQVHKFQFGGSKNQFRILPGLILALIFLADVRWGAYATLLWWAYSTAHWKKSWRRLIYDIITQTFLALILIAPLTFPLVEFILHSSRSGMLPEEALVFSLPFANLAGFLFPNGSVYHEWMLYTGASVLILAVLGATIRKADRKVLFWLGVFIVSLIFALGSQIPGMVYIARLPLMGLLRVPSRVLFITGMSLSVLAGYGLDLILGSPKNFSHRVINLALFSCIMFVIAISVGIYALNGYLPIGVIWGGIFLLIAVAWIGLKLKLPLPKEIWVSGLFVIVLVDLLSIDRSSLRFKEPGLVFSEGEEAAAYVSSKPGLFRIYSPSYSIPQHTAVEYRLHLADGVDPLQIDDYVEYMVLASGVPRNGYSVTTPPFEQGDPKVDNAKFTPDSKKLGLLNVRYVIADYEVFAEGLALEEKFDDVWVYRNKNQLPRAWVDISYGGAENVLKPAVVNEYKPNRITITAEGPGTLTLSEIDYPGWWIWIDGVLSPSNKFAGILRAVDLDPGVHTVSLIYLPISLLSGILLGLFGVLGIGIYYSKLVLNRIRLK